MIQCPDCKEQVSDAAPACPKCGRPMPDAKPPKKKLSKIQWALIIVACLFVVGAIGSRGGNQGAKTDVDKAQDKAERRDAFLMKTLRERNERQMKETGNKGVDVECSAARYYQDYHANEVAADAKYKGKWVRVRGAVGHVAKSIGDTPYLMISADGYGVAQVHADLLKAQVEIDSSGNATAREMSAIVGALRPGEKISLECLGGGMTMTIPTLHECLIFN